jgi:hypothetical protein
MSEVKEALKQLEREQERLLAQKKALEEELKKEQEAEAKLEELFQNSGFATPRALISALMTKYGVRSLTAGGESTGRRKRTKVTAELRDAIRNAVDGGLSKNQAAKDFEVSYAVVNKIMDGAYDEL